MLKVRITTTPRTCMQNTTVISDFTYSLNETSCQLIAGTTEYLENTKQKSIRKR